MLAPVDLANGARTARAVVKARAETAEALLRIDHKDQLIDQQQAMLRHFEGMAEKLEQQDETLKEQSKMMSERDAKIAHLEAKIVQLQVHADRADIMQGQLDRMLEVDRLLDRLDRLGGSS